MTKNLIELRDRLGLLLEADDEPKKKPAKKPARKAPPKEKPKSTPGPKIEDPKSKGEVTPPKNNKPPVGKAAPTSSVPISGHNDPNVARQANDYFRQMGLNAVPNEEEMRQLAAQRGAGGPPLPPAEPQPPNPDNLPDIIRTNLINTQFDGAPPDWQPNWKKVEQLPRMIQAPIRQLGSMVFSMFTDTPVGDIWHMSTPAGDSIEDLNLMGRWIQQNGVRDDAMRLRMEEAIPGYHGDILIYNTVGFTFVLVHDFAGHYIYAWPGGRGVHVGDTNVPKLESKTVSTRALVEYLIEGDPGVLTAPAPKKPGPLDGAATKLNRLIYELKPWIEHLPAAESIERHLLQLVARSHVVKPYPGRSDKEAQAAERKSIQRSDAAANDRSKHALDIMRAYIRLRQTFKDRGEQDLKGHILAVGALEARPKQFKRSYVDAIFTHNES